MMIKNILIIIGVVAAIILLVFVTRLVMLRKSVGDYKRYWEELSKQKAGDDDFVYIALGDSTAQAIGASKPENGYAGLVGGYIEKETGKNVKIYNLSVSGAKISDAIDVQIPKISNYPPPDLITIQIGANNIVDYEKESFREDFSRLLKKLPEKTVVSNIPSFSKGLQSGKYDQSKEASGIATSLIKDTNNLYFVDLFAGTDDISYLDFAADYFHPNDRAYKKWANAFIYSIEKNKLIKSD